MGGANQAGEDNRNVARMQRCSGSAVGIVPGATINRLCGSGLDAEWGRQLDRGFVLAMHPICWGAVSRACRAHRS